MARPEINKRSQSEEPALSRVFFRHTRSEAKKTQTGAVNELPPYNEMIIEAINGNMQRTKYSQYAISKTIREKYMKNIPRDFHKNLWKGLKDLVEKGVLVRTNNSFKFANKAMKSNSGQTLKESVKIVFPTRPRTPIVRNNSTPAIPTEIDEDAAESIGVCDETQDDKPTRSGSKVFIFKGTVLNAHFQ